MDHTAVQELWNIVSAGGNLAVPVILVFGLRFMAGKFEEAQKASADAHQQTIHILTDVVRDNTRAMQDTAAAIRAFGERLPPAPHRP